MFGSARLRLFRVRGIPISVDVSWLLIVALLTLTMTEFYRRAVPGLYEASAWALGLATALAFFVCIVLHELGHALVARGRGIPLRGITLFLFGGVAEMEGEPKAAGDEFWMAIAGPLVSAALAALLWGLSLLGIESGWPLACIIFCRYLAWINLSVLVFNLVPAFPLDGGRVLRSALWKATHDLRRATYWASLAGRGFALLLIGFGVLLFFNGDWVGGIWLGLIGLFLSNAALGSYQMVVIRQALVGEPVRRFMNPHPVVVPPSLHLRQLVEDYVYRLHHKMFPVVGPDGRLEGVITTPMLADIPRGEWEHHTVGEVMRRDVGPITISPDTDALYALERMQRTGVSRLLVTEGDRLVGIVSLKDLLRFLHLKLELGGHEEAEGLREPGALSGGPARREEEPAHV